MIDVENEVYTEVVTALRTDFSTIYTSGDITIVPPSFPAIFLYQMDNSTYERTLDSSGDENHADVIFQAEIFSNSTAGKKSEAKSIMAALDDEMLGMGFTRTSSSPMPMPNKESTIYRIVARYRAVISKDSTIYRR